MPLPDQEGCGNETAQTGTYYNNLRIVRVLTHSPRIKMSRLLKMIFSARS